MKSLIFQVLQRVPRATTVLAIRFSQLARLPEGLLNFIKIKFPQVVILTSPYALLLVH